MLVKPLLVAMDAQDLDVEIWFNVAFSCFWVMLDMVLASHCRQTCGPCLSCIEFKCTPLAYARAV